MCGSRESGGGGLSPRGLGGQRRQRRVHERRGDVRTAAARVLPPSSSHGAHQRVRARVVRAAERQHAVGASMAAAAVRCFRRRQSGFQRIQRCVVIGALRLL
jgi:hypothetical protein